MLVTLSQSAFAQKKERQKYTPQSYSDIWELDSNNKKGTFRLTSYKPTYVTAGRWSNSPNTLPVSENPDYRATTPIPYNNYESKFQFSLKTKIAQSALWGTADVWVGYTQKAHWQIYNTEISRVFRELNYEPEVILNFPIMKDVLGFKFRTAGVSFNHQSNGKDLPFSRSWNRVIFHAGFDKKNFHLVLRPWIRLKDEEDENPLITDFYGRGELTANYAFKRMEVTLLVTHPLNRLDKGSYSFNYIFPLSGKLRAQVQFFRGYGETLIDYNHYQFTSGLGISFSDW